MKKLIRIGLSAMVPLVLIAGCKAAVAPMPNGSLAEITALGSLAGGKVLSSAPRDGMANVRVKLRVKEGPVPGFQVLAMPKEWEAAVVSLHSKTANGAFDADFHSRLVEAGDFSRIESADDTEHHATVQFPPLRPSSDYEARVYLKNIANEDTPLQLAGSQVLDGIPLKPGPNELVFDVAVNRDQYGFRLASSEAGNSVEDNAVTVGDVVTLATGMEADQPGVERVEIYLSGDCYDGGEGPTLIGRLDAAGSWDTFTWDTTQALEDVTPTEVGAALFAPTSLMGVVPESTDIDQFPYAPGQITVVAYNDHDERVGIVKFDLRVYAKPSVTIRLQ